MKTFTYKSPRFNKSVFSSFPNLKTLNLENTTIPAGELVGVRSGVETICLRGGSVIVGIKNMASLMNDFQALTTLTYEMRQKKKGEKDGTYDIVLAERSSIPIHGGSSSNPVSGSSLKSLNRILIAKDGSDLKGVRPTVVLDVSDLSDLVLNTENPQPSMDAIQQPRVGVSILGYPSVTHSQHVFHVAYAIRWMEMHGLYPTPEQKEVIGAALNLPVKKLMWLTDVRMRYFRKKGAGTSQK